MGFVRSRESPEEPSDKIPLKFHEAVRLFRRHLLMEALTANMGNRSSTARALGIQRTYLARLIRQYGIEVPRKPRHNPDA